MYGRQLADLFEHFPREQVLVLRYRPLVDDPHDALNQVAASSASPRTWSTEIPSGNSRPFVHPSCAPRCSARSSGPVPPPGQFLPPQAWRTASRPLIGQLHQRGNPERPRLTPEQGDALRQPFLEDIALLEQVTGESYDDWRASRRRLVPHPAARRAAAAERRLRGTAGDRSSGRAPRRVARASK